MHYIYCFYIIIICFVPNYVKGILHGKNASVNQFPYIVSLRNSNNDHLDAGILISHRFALSTAWTLKFNPIRIITGSVTLHSGGVSYRIVSSYLHPRYDEITFKHNIGLIKTQNYITFNDGINAIGIGNIKIGPDVPVIGVGWGDSKNAIKSRTNILKWAKLLTIHHDTYL